MSDSICSQDTGSQDTEDSYSTGSQDTVIAPHSCEIQETGQHLSIIHSIIESIQSGIQSTILSLISTGYDRQDDKLIQWIQEQPLTISTTPIQHILTQYK